MKTHEKIRFLENLSPAAAREFSKQVDEIRVEAAKGYVVAAVGTVTAAVIAFLIW